MINITRADAMWLKVLLDQVEFIYREYPELFNKEDEEALKIAGELIRSIQ